MRSFDRPLSVLVGLGTPLRLADVIDALAYLENLPMMSRDEAHEATVSACREALAGEIDQEQAYDIVCGYARRRGVYLEDTVVELSDWQSDYSLAA